MGFLLLLPLLVSGFLVCLKHPVIYFRLHRYEGQLLYLQVARYGMNCLFVSFAFFALMSLIVSHSWAGFCFPKFENVCVPAFSTDFLSWIGSKFVLMDLAKSEQRGQLAAFTVLVGVGSMLLPVPWTRLLIRKLRKKVNRRLARRPSAVSKAKPGADDDVLYTYLLKESVTHSPRLTMLYQAFATREQVMLSMEDRKVYVGYISSLGAPTEVSGIDQELQLIPTISGYRDDDTREVKYTTHYSVIDIECPIVLKQENIVSVTMFNVDVRIGFDKLNIDKALNADQPAANEGGKN
jgi:hypothetical protein